MKPKKTSGFTLVEILIVVVILGVLAAIVIPQFTNASTDAKLNSLCNNLRIMRGQIELFKLQNDDLLPGQAVANGNIVEADFFNALYGTYIQKFPKNLFIGDVANRTSVTCVNGAGALPAVDDSTAWWVNAANGDFRANTAGHAGY